MTVELHIYLVPRPDRKDDLTAWFTSDYLPALYVQPGFRSAVLLEGYSEDARRAIDAATPAQPTLVVIRFESERDRARWQVCDDHARVWPQMSNYAEFSHHVGWTVAAQSETQP